MKGPDRFRLARAWTTRTTLADARPAGTHDGDHDGGDNGCGVDDGATWPPPWSHKHKARPLQLKCSGTWESLCWGKALQRDLKSRQKSGTD